MTLMKYLFTLIIVAIAIFLVYAFQAKKKVTFNESGKFQNLTFEGKMGQENLSNDPAQQTIIIWFHPECKNCQYQLDIINRNIKKLAETRFIFITADKNFFKNKISSLWPDLVQSASVTFGIIDKSRFINEFGPVITPSLLLFNKGGILKEKLYGEVKVEKIIHLIKNTTVPEQTMSGSK